MHKAKQYKGVAVAAAVCAVAMAASLATHAGAADNVSGYIMVGNTRVARSLNVHTEAQLAERLRQGYVQVTFDQYARPITVEPLNDGQ